MATNILKIILQTIKKGKGAKETEKEVDKLNKSLARMAKGAVAGFIAFKTLGKAFDLTIGNAIESEKLMAATMNVIEATGQAAGVTATQIDDYAESLQRLSGVDSEVIQGGQNLLLTFKEIKGEGGVFDRATRSMLDMAVAMNQGNLEGVDLKSTAIQLGKALNVAAGDTTAAGMALSALARVGVSFTDSQKEAAKAAVELGDVMEFQNIILNELESEFGGAAEAAGDTLAGAISRLELEIGDAGQTLGDELIPHLADAAMLMNAMIGPTESAAAAFDEFRAKGDDANAAVVALTRGQDILGDAFDENRARMFEMVIASEMTVAEFNRNIDATRELANSYGQVEGGMWKMAQQIEGDNIPAQQELTEELVKATQIGRELEASDRALAQARGSLKNVTAEIVPTETELAEAEKVATEAAKAQAAAAREQAESLEAARGRAAATAIEFDNLAQSLIEATNADLAKVALDNLGMSLEEGKITQGEYQTATRDVMLTFGLATQESLNLADSLGDVNQLYDDGKISADEYTEILGTLNETGGSLDQALGLLDITIGGINEVQGEAELSALALSIAQEDTTGSTEDLTVASEDLTDKLSDLKDRQFDVTKSADLVRLSQGEMIGAINVSASAVRAAATDWMALLNAMQGVANAGGFSAAGGGASPPPQFQHGGDIGRFGIVGDAGPELVVGNRVFSNPQTDRLIAAIETLVNAFPSSMGNTTNNNINLPAGISAAQQGAHMRALIGSGRT